MNLIEGSFAIAWSVGTGINGLFNAKANPFEKPRSSQLFEAQAQCERQRLLERAWAVHRPFTIRWLHKFRHFDKRIAQRILPNLAASKHTFWAVLYHREDRLPG